MFLIFATIAFAALFKYIGDNEHDDKGLLFGGVSVGLSLLGGFSGFGIIGLAALNILFFVGLTVYNVTSKKPPSSGTGF